MMIALPRYGQAATLSFIKEEQVTNITILRYIDRIVSAPGYERRCLDGKSRERGYQVDQPRLKPAHVFKIVRFYVLEAL